MVACARDSELFRKADTEPAAKHVGMVGRRKADSHKLPREALRQFVVANWVSLGQVKLSAGTHRLRIEVLQNEGAVCFDAFLLSTNYIVPRSKLKPNEKYRLAMDGWFAFEPDADTFRPSPIDLRYLNEKFAEKMVGCGQKWAVRAQ